MTTARRRLAGLAALLAAGLVVVFARSCSSSEDEPRRAPAVAPPEVGAVPAKPRAPRTRDPAAPDALPPARPDAAKEAVVPDEEMCPFLVRVLRADGAPAVGATVVLLGDHGRGEWAEELLPPATAGAEGLVLLTVPILTAPVRTVRAAAWLGAEAHVTGELIDVTTRHEVTLRLTPAMTVRGRVLLDEKPVPGADVELSAHPWFGSGFPLELRATSDAAGRFEFPPIPHAGLRPPNPPIVIARTKDMAWGGESADPATPDEEVVVRLRAGWTARVRFLDADGRPAAAELRALGLSEERAEADAAGRASLRLESGNDWKLVAVRTTSHTVIADAGLGAPVVENWQVVRILGERPSESTTDMDFGDVVLSEGKPLSGRVVDAAGRGSPSAKAGLFLGKIRVGSVVADKEGRFTFPEVGEQSHRVLVWEKEEGSPQRLGRAADVRGGDPELRIVLEPAFAIRMTFLSADDRRPMQTRRVHVKAWRRGEEWAAETAEYVGDPMDSYAIEVPAAGAYDLEVVLAGYETQRFESVEVVANRPATLELLLRKKAE